jgi:hypothetical protein
MEVIPKECKRRMSVRIARADSRASRKKAALIKTQTGREGLVWWLGFDTIVERCAPALTGKMTPFLPQPTGALAATAFDGVPSPASEQATKRWAPSQGAHVS